MGQFLNFGNGSDGIATLSGTHAPIDSSCSGTAAATSLAATNASFAAGQIILIHQARGTGAGQWEFNKIASYVAGTITTVLPLDYTYTDSGNSQAQVIVVSQYSAISGSLTAKAWDGNVGGFIPLLCSGKATIDGSIIANGTGFRGGSINSNSTGNQGESTLGAGVQSITANGIGGGGGEFIGTASPACGGGGGYATAGADAPDNVAGATNRGGDGGSTIGIPDLTTIMFGGGGGAGGDKNEGGGQSGGGGNGGGIIMIFATIITITGSIGNNGNAGINGAGGGNKTGGGGGAGGSVFLKGQIVTLGALLTTTTGGAGGTGINNDSQTGGVGGDGRIRVETCSLTGTSNPSANESVGGHSFCAVGGGIFSE